MDSLRWELQWGEHVQFLVDMEEETGETPEALLSRVEIEPENEEFWDAFWLLHSSRRDGVLPFDAITGYCRDTGMPDPVDFLPFARILLAMDRVYVEHVRKPAPER